MESRAKDISKNIKKVFNQIKKYKNKKSLKKAFDKKEGIKPKPKPTAKPKPKITPTTVSTAKKISDIAKIPFKGGAAEIKAIDKLLGNIPSTAIKYAWQHPIQTIAGTYAAGKAVDIGKKMFGGGQLETNVKSTDITPEVTGTSQDKTSIAAPTTGGGNVYNDFVAAHNSAMDAGKQHFDFQGKIHYVGPSRLQDL